MYDSTKQRLQHALKSAEQDVEHATNNITVRQRELADAHEYLAECTAWRDDLVALLAKEVQD